MRTKINWIGIALLAWAAGAAPARAGAEWGGSYPPGRAQHLRLQGGVVFGFEGMVAETTRKLYDVTGHTWKQDTAETYDTSDFNLDDSYGLIGLSCEAAWKFVGLQLDTAFFQPSTRSTARRDYYLAVGEDIDYQGNSYDHLMIPAGRTFDAELNGNVTELTLRLVPVGFQAGDFLHVNPSLGVGVLFFGGKYEIDAGETVGVKTYQNPPEDFAIGGQTSGYAGLITPQWGPGLQIRLGDREGLGLDLQIHYLLFDYDGSTSLFTSSDHREKNVDFSHRNLRIRGQVEIPMKRTALNLGLQVQFVETEGTLTSQATDPEEILAKQERFDKEFTFQVDAVLATLGLTF